MCAALPTATRHMDVLAPDGYFRLARKYKKPGLIARAPRYARPCRHAYGVMATFSTPSRWWLKRS